jgi:hypothetical protein
MCNVHRIWINYVIIVGHWIPHNDTVFDQPEVPLCQPAQAWCSPPGRQPRPPLPASPATSIGSSLLNSLASLAFGATKYLSREARRNRELFIAQMKQSKYPHMIAWCSAATITLQVTPFTLFIALRVTAHYIHGVTIGHKVQAANSHDGYNHALLT